MKECKRGTQPSSNPFVVVARSLLVAGFLVLLVKAWAQSVPPPALAITSRTTNAMVITITNGVSTVNYDLYWSPALAGPEVDWQALPPPSGPGQTNFLVPLAGWPAAFFRAEFDTNSVPLWQAANPANPAAGILAVFIDSPTNGAVVP